MNSFNKKYFAKKEEFEKIQKELWAMQKECPHEECRASLVETLAYEFTPKHVCIACGKNLTSTVSKDEVKECYRKELEDLYDENVPEDKLEEFYQKNPNGYNLPRRIK